MTKIYILPALLIFIALSACDNGFDTKALIPPVTGTDTEPPAEPTPTPTPDPTIPDGTPCGDARLEWTNPDQYINNGGPILEPLLRNTVYMGFIQNQYGSGISLSNPGATGTYRVINLEKGRTYYFGVTATTQNGLESEPATGMKTITTCAQPLTEKQLAEENIIDAQLFVPTELMQVAPNNNDSDFFEPSPLEPLAPTMKIESDFFEEEEESPPTDSAETSDDISISTLTVE